MARAPRPAIDPAVAPEACTTGRHSADCVSQNRPSSAGKDTTGSTPSSASRRATADARSAAPRASLRRAIAGAGVAAGANTANQLRISKSGSPPSAAVGSPGSSALRAGRQLRSGHRQSGRSGEAVAERRVERDRKQMGKNKQVCPTDADATMATNARNRRLEPAYKQHTAVDDVLGVFSR